MPKADGLIRFDPPLYFDGPELPDDIDALCSVANNSNAYPDDELELVRQVFPVAFEVLPLLVDDAERLLQDIEDNRASGAEDDVLKSVQSSRRPRLKIREKIADAFGEVPYSGVERFDAKQARIVRDSVEDLVVQPNVWFAYVLAIAVESGQWRNLRRCQHILCGKYFYQDRKSGGRSKRYCTPSHRVAHRQWLERHGDEE